MKFGVNSVIIAALAVQAQANVYYWCSSKACEAGQSVGPTYDCGNKFFNHYYESGNKKWRRSGDELDSDTFWKTDGFYDCCHDAGKKACYDIKNT